MNKTIEKVARRYLVNMGYNILGSTDDFLVCDTEEGITFVHVLYDKDEFPDTDRKELMSMFEEAQAAWFMEKRYDVNIPILCDELSFRILSEDRALLRHHVDINFSGVL